MNNYDVMHAFMLVLFYLCLYPHSLNPTLAHHYQSHPPSMVISSPSSSVSAATAVVIGPDNTLDSLEIIQLIWITFTGQIASYRALVYSVRCIHVQCNKGSMYIMLVCFL